MTLPSGDENTDSVLHACVASTRVSVEVSREAVLRTSEKPGRPSLYSTLDRRQPNRALRGAITGAFGDGAAAQLGFVGATPSDARALVKLARTVSERASKVKFGPARKGVKIDVVAVFEGVAAQASALEETLSELAREGREETEALVKRDLALAVARERRVGLASVLRGLYTFVGDHERAARVFDAVAGSHTAASEPAKPEGDKPAS